jgi:hypothetical protein
MSKQVLTKSWCGMVEDEEWTVNGDHDIRVASWRVASLLFGPDDGTMERDDIECQIQEALKESFRETEGSDPVFGPVDPENPPPGYRPANPPPYRLKQMKQSKSTKLKS